MTALEKTAKILYKTELYRGKNGFKRDLSEVKGMKVKIYGYLYESHTSSN